LIKHVVVIVQENRSFDNMFNGFPGADTIQSGPTHTGAVIALQSQPLEFGVDFGHFHFSWVSAYNGGAMNGFDLEHEYGIVNGSYVETAANSTRMYAYVPRYETVPYWTLAQNYVLADRMFESNTGPSFPAHQYLIAGQSDDASEVPDGTWGCDAAPGTTVTVLNAQGEEVTGPFPCFTYTTLAQEMDAAGVTWRYYADAYGASGYVWSAYDAVRYIRYGADWTSDVISPETAILTDVPAGTLAQVTWVTPSQPNSDHPLGKSNTGPEWVSSVVNAIGESPQWNNTAIFVLWDDWGGFYDHVLPQRVDIMGRGFRVPLMLISPYAKRGYVSHVTHEFGSILKFTEEVMGLPSMGTRDAISDDFADCFDFTQKPRPYTPLATRLSPEFFLRQKRSLEPPDPI
jgi:phospholipase C